MTTPVWSTARCVFSLAFTAIAILPVHAQLVADGATNTLSNVTNNIIGDVRVCSNGEYILRILFNSPAFPVLFYQLHQP